MTVVHHRPPMNQQCQRVSDNIELSYGPAGLHKPRDKSKKTRNDPEIIDDRVESSGVEVKARVLLELHWLEYNFR